jgi:hypothetical protein
MLIPTNLKGKEREAYIKDQPNPTRKLSTRIQNKHPGLRSPKAVAAPKPKAKPHAASSR